MGIFEHAVISVCRVSFEIRPGLVELAVKISVQRLMVKGDQRRNCLRQIDPLARLRPPVRRCEVNTEPKGGDDRQPYAQRSPPNARNRAQWFAPFKVCTAGIRATTLQRL